MDKVTTINKLDFLNDNSFGRNLFNGSLIAEIKHINLTEQKLKAEGGDNFIQYFERLGLSNESSLIILPSTHHYYYDAEDMKEVKVVLNLKQLNHIKEIKDFLHNIFHILSYQSFFIGAFVDRKDQNVFFPNARADQKGNNGAMDPVENGIESRIPFLNMMYNLMDSKTNRYMSKSAVKLLLGDAGFRVINIAEIDGRSYFCAQKVRKHED